MNVKKALLVTGASTIVGLASFAGVASAATSGNSSDDGSTLADKIATKFNLNKDDVQKVFDEDRSEHQADRQQKLEERLTQAVTDGKITADQKDQILAKLKELQTYADSLKDKAPSERRELMKTKMDELRQWAKDNGLGDYVQPFGGMRAHGPHGDMAPDDAPAGESATQS